MLSQIDTFEQQCVVLKGIFQSPRLKYHVQTIGIDSSLINNAIYEYKFLKNIKKLYKQAGKCDDQQQFKDILEAAMVSNPEGFTNDITISPITSTPVKQPSDRNHCIFSQTYYMQRRKLLPIELELLNQSSRKYNIKLHHGH